jgi:hypothetical protein
VLSVLAQREGHVLQHRERVEQRGVLEDHPELLAHAVELVLVEHGEVVAVDPDVARGRLLQADEHAQERGLACARSADDHGRLAAAQVHRDAEEHLRLTEGLAHVVHEDVILGGMFGAAVGPRSGRIRRGW